MAAKPPLVKIQFCGVCHSGLYPIRGNCGFPLVPGHEFVGEATAIHEVLVLPTEEAMP